VAAFCYCFFRLGNALRERPLQERILAGYFLCGDQASGVIDALRPEWAPAQQGSLDDRISFLEQVYPDFSLDDIFPLSDQFSEGIEKYAFIRSHFVQPDLFLRPRPGKLKELTSKLQAAGISFRKAGEQGIALDNATRLETVGVPDRDFVIQDLSSQRTVDFLPEGERLPAKPAIWDACAGSGGKSIMAFDQYPSCRLYVTDIRSSILQNLSARFRTAGIRDYRSAVLDLSVMDKRNMTMPDFLPSGGFDLVIADVPCSGSGTWGRDPWALSLFGLKDLEDYANRQRAIMSGLLKTVKPGGFLLYITCSVYALENESMVAFAEKQGNLRVLKSGLIRGYQQRADTLYAALFTSTRG
jgi:16S rRNA (cytosine967-C5)-methyltransferase